MSELRDVVAKAIFRLFDPKATGHWERYQDNYRSDADVIIRAIEASGRVTVDRARFERLRIAAYTFKECGGLANLPQTYEEAGLQPGDLEPLP